MINSLGAYVQNVFVTLPSHEASQQLQQLNTAATSPTMLSGIPIGRFLLIKVPGLISSVADPDSNRQAGSELGIWIRILQVKLSYNNTLFKQIFHDFILFFKMILLPTISKFRLIKYLPYGVPTK